MKPTRYIGFTGYEGINQVPVRLTRTEMQLQKDTKYQRYRKLRNLQDARASKRDYIHTLLDLASCIDCGESDTRTLTFSQPKGTDSIGHLASQAVSGKRLRTAIAKADVLCRNCEARRG